MVLTLTVDVVFPFWVFNGVNARRPKPRGLPISDESPDPELESSGLRPTGKRRARRRRKMSEKKAKIANCCLWYNLTAKETTEDNREENEEVKAAGSSALGIAAGVAKCQVASLAASHFDEDDDNDDDANDSDSDAFCLANAFFCFESLIRERTKKRLLSPVYPLNTLSNHPA